MSEPLTSVLQDDAVFCWARPRYRDWREYDHATMEQGRGMRPVMLRGQRFQTVYVLASQYGDNPVDFELYSALEPPPFPNEAPGVP